MERDIVELAQRGDREAFAILARSSADRLFAVAQRILRDTGRAEDAVQQTLVIAWRELPRLRDPDRFDAWIHRLLVHACYLEARNARIATGQVQELASTALDIIPTRTWNQSPRWSPDGQRIVFYRPTFESDGSISASSLFVVDVDGSELTELTTVPFAGDPEWSPDGATIAFSTYPRRVDQAVGERVAEEDIYTIRPDGTDLMQLTADGVSAAPSWTSDGRILYISAPIISGILATDIFVMAADGTDQRMVTSFVYLRGQCCTFYAQARPTP